MCIKRGCDSLCPDGVLPPKNAMYVEGASRAARLPAQLTDCRLTDLRLPALQKRLGLWDATE